jgi:glycosyl transferase family 25
MWDYFDAIYCINLFSRNDKYEQMKNLFLKYNIPVKFHRVHKDNENPTRGCFNSHLSVMKEAYNKDCKNVLIFEDDINFNYYSIEKLNRCINFMSNNYYELFFLGSFPDIKNFSVTETGYNNIYKMNSMCGHAYVVSRNYMEKIINCKYMDVPLDYLFKFNKNSYGILPPLVVQTAQHSDINSDLINRNKYLKWCTSRYICLYSKHGNIKINDIITYLLIFNILIGVYFLINYLIYLLFSLFVFFVWSYNDYLKHEKDNRI